MGNVEEFIKEISYGEYMNQVRAGKVPGAMTRGAMKAAGGVVIETTRLSSDLNQQTWLLNDEKWTGNDWYSDHDAVLHRED